MKGHMEDGKFHPHTQYKKGVRKSRDQTTKSKGIRFKHEMEICPKCGKKKHLTGYGKCQSCYADGDTNSKTVWKVVLENPRAESGTTTHYITLGRQANEEDVKNALLRMYDYDHKTFKYYPQDLEFPNLHSIERQKRFTDDEHPYDITKAEPILETELNDIFDPVTIKKRGVPTEQIDYAKLDHVAKSEIEYILEREKILGKDETVEVTLVDVRPETSREEFKKTGSGDTGSYQYDYKIYKNGSITPFAGTAYGSISMGQVMDMNLELYDVR